MAYDMYINKHLNKIIHHARNNYADILEVEIFLYATNTKLNNDEKKIINATLDELCRNLDTYMKAYYSLIGC